jgi:uncharacterized protein (DUF58 family)
MRLVPTRRAERLVLVGGLGMALGIALARPEAVVLGGALWLGVALARALGRVLVARVRAAGFEMVWLEETRSMTTFRLEAVQLRAEFRNHDSSVLRFRDLIVTAAPGVEVVPSVTAGVIGPSGTFSVTLTARGLSSGYHGIFGFSVRVSAAPGLFSVPLSFSSPVVLCVLPRVEPVALARTKEEREGGATPLSRRHQSGAGVSFRELREYRSGDPLRKVAWKASARRGKLLVAETDMERAQQIWIVLDASLENWSGPAGARPIDLGLDAVASLAEAYLSVGAHVGLVALARRELLRILPGRGVLHRSQLLHGLASRLHTSDPDRSAWSTDEAEWRALEHAHSLQPGAPAVGPEPEGRIRFLESAAAQSPLGLPGPKGPRRREAVVAHYLRSYGISPPPGFSAERTQTERRLVDLLQDLGRAKHRPSLVHLLVRAPSPDTPRTVDDALRQLVRRRIEVHCTFMDELPGTVKLETLEQRVVHDALRAKLQLAEERGAQRWGQLGIRVRTSMRRSP